MANKEIPEILEEAQTFARELHTHKMFDGFNEAEVMKGTAGLSIALNHFINNGIPLETVEGTQHFFDILKDAGIYDDNWGRSGEVAEILTKILCAGKEGADHE